MKETILNCASDIARDFIYYNRKDCEDLPLGVIEKAIRSGEITVDEIVAAFKEDLLSWGGLQEINEKS